MAISTNKKRYSITLTPSNVERFQALTKELGMPANVMSNVCEMQIISFNNLLQTAKDNGKFDISDLAQLMGKQLELAVELERRNHVPEQKRDSISNGKKSARTRKS